ncbi:MAG: hypothetical protein IKR74_00955 [Bacilli bacterium]|nr:hypothetical protein [Bacilli bacterium]
MKKLFGGINLTWKKVILFAIIIGILVGGLNSIPLFKDTSFTDSAIYFDVWILFGILIIMNSTSNIDSALKCFAFFLISQPLIYLVEVPFSYLGWQLFNYYKFWFYWTILCLPMGFFGYYMKKDKWWGIIFLIPMMFLLGIGVSTYLSHTIYSFPRHILSLIFSVLTMIIYPLAIFNNKFAKYGGLSLGIVLIIAFSLMTLFNKPVYETDVLCTGGTDKLIFDDTYTVYLKDKKYGEVSIKNYDSFDEAFFCVHALFKKSGKTELELTSPEGDKKEYNIKIARDTYQVEEKKE